MIGQAVIDSTHRIPNKALVLRELTPDQKQLIPVRYRNSSYTGYDVRYLVGLTRDSIPLSVWADAIGAATIKALGCTATVAETVLGPISQGGYLTLGDFMYKVNVTQAMSTNKALANMRRTITRKVEAEAEAIRVKARQDAQAITDAAQQAAHTVAQNATRLRLQAETLMREATTDSRPPLWAVNNAWPIKYNGGQWQVGMMAKILINLGFDYLYEYRPAGAVSTRQVTKHWGSVPSTLPVRVLCWVPISAEGAYAATSIYVDQGSTVMPHVTTNGGCMQLADSPPSIRGHHDMNNLQGSFERCHRAVQLNSLYSDPTRWVPAFERFIPDDLKAILRHGDWGDRIVQVITEDIAAGRLQPVATGQMETQEVWSA